MKTSKATIRLIRMTAWLSLIAPTLGEEAPPAAAPEQAQVEQSINNDEIRARTLEMVKAGCGPDQGIALPGFGGATLAASSYTVETFQGGKWQDMVASNIAVIGSFSAAIRHAPADWKEIQALIHSPGEGDKLTVSKCLWNQISTWIVDLTLAAGTHPGLTATRCRYLIAPVDTGFVMLSFMGPEKQFEADRPAMREAALSVRFGINGLIAEYYNSPALDSLSCFQVDANIDYDWSTNSPPNGTGPDWFSIRWSGQVQPRYTETYTLTANSDDGIRVWVNNVLVIENWSDHASTQDSAQIDLKAGEKADIRVEWYENRGHSVARLFWQSASQAYEVIPGACLSATTKTGFAPVPEYGGKSLSAPANWPELIYTTLPGGYKADSPQGLKWDGESPSQTMVIGDGGSKVNVSLKRMRVRPVDAKSLMPAVMAGDSINVSKVAWRYTPATLEPVKPVKKGSPPPVVEYYASAWSVNLTLDARNHPDTKLLYRWYCLVPLKDSMLVFCFESTDKDWQEKNWDGYRTVFDSVTLVAEEQVGPVIEETKTEEILTF